jgi:hypothetical protein
MGTQHLSIFLILESDMKTLQLTVDLKNAKNEQDVFNAFNNILHFASDEQFQSWRMGWDSFDDMLWGYIQGPITNDPVPYDNDVERLGIRVINSKHLDNVQA